jgi:hypothetical protein
MNQEEKNNPLSCHLGTHFTRRIGRDEVCMYCNGIMKLHLGDIEFGSMHAQVFDFSNKHKDTPVKYLQENPLTPKDVLLRNVEKHD